MGFLDQKERILDIVLTDKGRELLSKNQLNFIYYAFSDEGMDYSGSLSVVRSSSFDNYVHRDLSFEADQRKNRDLTSFLYTIPHGQKVLPKFTLSINNSASINLERTYRMDTIILRNRIPATPLTPPIDVVVRASTPKLNFKSRVDEYINLQKVKQFLPQYLDYIRKK